MESIFGFVCKDFRDNKLFYITGAITIANLALPISAVCSGLTGFLFSGLITVFVSLLSKRLVATCLHATDYGRVRT
jgi:hypothetical protein